MNDEPEELGEFSAALLAGLAGMGGLFLLFLLVSLFVVRLGPCADAPEWWFTLLELLPLLLPLGALLGAALFGGRSKSSPR